MGVFNPVRRGVVEPKRSATKDPYYGAILTVDLLERVFRKSRTNLLINSGTMSSFSLTNATNTTDGTTAPSGTTARKIMASSTGTTNVSRSITSVQGTTVTYSITGKKGSGATDANRLYIHNVSTAADLIGVSVNWDTGVATTLTGSGVVTSTSLGNGWYRFSLTVSSGITAGNNLTVYAGFIGGSETSGEYAYFADPQFELGAVATPYIATTATAVTIPEAYPTFEQMWPTVTNATTVTSYSETPDGKLVPWRPATNLVLQSQNLTASWATNASPTITADYAAAPDGTLTADRLQGSAGASSGVFQNGITTTATEHTYSVFLKDNGGSSKTVRLAIGAAIFGGAGGDRNIDFNLSTQAFSNVNAVFTSYSATSVGNGWWRVAITFTGTSSTSTAAVVIYSTEAGMDILVWGAQLQTGSVATAYIPTTTAAVTQVRPRWSGRGLSVEESRTNLLQNNGLSGTGGTGGAPDNWQVGFETGTGSVQASGIRSGANSRTCNVASGQRQFIQQTINVAANTTYTVSIYVEAFSGSPGDLFAYATGLPAGATTETLSPPTSTGRKSFKITVGGTAGTAVIRIGLGTSGNATGTGSVTWSNPQVEAGTFETSLIPTSVGSTATRAADSIGISGLSVPGGSFTAYVEATSLSATATGDEFLLQMDGGSDAERIVLYRIASTNQSGVFVSANSVTLINHRGNPLMAAGTHKMAVQATAAGAPKGAVDGTLTAAGSTGTVGTLTAAYLGRNRAGGAPANAYLRKVVVYPRAFTDAELQVATL